MYNLCFNRETLAGPTIKSCMEDQGSYDVYAASVPDNLSQIGKNMLIPSNEKAHLVANFLKRYFFRESGYVSDNFCAK